MNTETKDTETKIELFNYEETPVRTVIKDGEPWFVLTDVCRVLEIENSSMVSPRLAEDEKDEVSFN